MLFPSEQPPALYRRMSVKKQYDDDDGRTIANMDVDGIDDSLTSIDIYLNAVNKIANTNDTPIHENSNVELNLTDILSDLEKK